MIDSSSMSETMIEKCSRSQIFYETNEIDTLVAKSVILFRTEEENNIKQIGIRLVIH